MFACVYLTVWTYVMLLLFSPSGIANSWWPHRLQLIRLPYPSLTPGVCSNSCPLSQWYHLILCCPLLLLPSIIPSIRVFSNESALHIRWPKYCNFSFSISPSNKCSGLISFRTDWFDLLTVQGILKSLLQHYSSKASSALNLLYGPTLTSVYDYWKKQASLVAQMVKNPPAMLETWVQSLGWEDSLKEGMVTHSSFLAWRIPTDRRAWRTTHSPCGL